MRAQQARAQGPNILGAPTIFKFKLFFPKYLLFTINNLKIFGLLHDIEDCQMFKEGPSPPVSVHFKICHQSRVLLWPLRAPSSLGARGLHMAKSGELELE